VPEKYKTYLKRPADMACLSSKAGDSNMFVGMFETTNDSVCFSTILQLCTVPHWRHHCLPIISLDIGLFGIPRFTTNGATHFAKFRKLPFRKNAKIDSDKSDIWTTTDLLSI